MSEKHEDRLTRFATKLGILASVVTIFGLPIAIFQLHDFLSEKLNRSIDLLNNYDLQLDLGVNPGIRSALEDGRPILQEDGGKFTDDQLADYVDIYSSMLGDTYENNLIQEDELCDDQCYYIENGFGNNEVRTFIIQTQKGDPLVWSGLLQEAAALVEYDEKTNGGVDSSTLEAFGIKI